MAASTEGIQAGIEGGGRDGAHGLNTKPLFKLMVDRKASDLFFTANSPIKIKIEGQIFPINKQILAPDTVRDAAYGLMTPEQLEYFHREYEIDFAISEPGLGRFRVNVFHQRGYPAMVLRYHEHASSTVRPARDGGTSRPQARADPLVGHRLGQVHDARGDDRPPQRDCVGHIIDPDDRVPAHQQALDRQLREVGIDTRSYDRRCVA
jgi:twitching motility protein PilU